MKKSLVALAVLGASGLAAAQSSVTLYGLADAGIGSIAEPVLSGNFVNDAFGNPYGVNSVCPGPQCNPAALQGVGVPAQVTNTIFGLSDTAVGWDLPGNLQWYKKTKFISGKMMNNAPSRVGVTGVEDIGNGTKVGFQFESGLSLEDGKPDTEFWQRNANVFVSGGWGTVKLGRQLTVTHLTEGAYDLTGIANYSVVRNTFGANGFVARAPSAIAYISPNMGGFTAAVAFVSKHNLGTASNVWDAGVMYNNGPIGVGAAINKGLDNGKANYHVGAKYSFGNFTVAASYHNGTSDGGITRADRGYWDIYGNPVVDVFGDRITSERVRRGFSLGGQAKFGAFTVTLDVTRDTKNEWTGDWRFNSLTGWTWAPKKYTNAVLEAKYALSKRTFLYGAALRLDGTNNWGLGISHSF